MKILHIFTNMNYVYTGALIDLFNNWLPMYEQEFLICDHETGVSGEIKECLKKNRRIHCLKTKNIRLQIFEIKKYEKEFDYIIYHFLPNDVLLHLHYFVHRKLLKKVIWRIWGADLYNWKKDGIQGILLNYIRKFTRKNIPYIIAEPMDIPEFEKQFNKNKVIFLDGPDPKGYDEKFLEGQLCKKEDKAIWILVGHSAVKTLHHKEVLDRLSSYKTENIKIILPLNYGDMLYAKEVYNYALSIFSDDKILCIKEKMNLEEYASLLWKCDIQIIHSERQIAMGNITMMMYMKKKIFLLKDSIMDNYYRKKENLEIYDSRKIGNISYDEFIKHDCCEKNKNFAIREIDMSLIADRWRSTFEMLEKMKGDNSRD